MKYVLVAPFWIVLFILSMLLGGIMYLWKFSEKDFFRGARYINGKIKFSDWYFKY
jgi:hypothetical protein